MDAEPESCPRPLDRRDASALIGVLAILEGHSLAGQLGEAVGDDLSRRLTDVGLLPGPASEQDFRRAVNDLGHRVRHALGEDDTAPIPRAAPS